MTASSLARALRAYVRYAPGTAGKALLIDHYLDHRLRTRPISTTVRLRCGDRVPVATGDVIQRFQYLFGEWEPHLSAFLRSRLQPGDTFIDVGAHRGAFSLLASRLVGPQGRVVALEPTPDYHAALAAAVSFNRRTNIRTIQAAASDTTGTVTLYLEDPANLGHTTAIRPRHVHAQFQAPMAPLPELVSDVELATARVIKIDVEGAEAAVLRGLLPALPRLRNDVEIVAEVTPRLLAKQGESVEFILQAMRQQGFRIYRLANDYDPATYPRAMQRPGPLLRCTEIPLDMSDIVFSRVAADRL